MAFWVGTVKFVISEASVMCSMESWEEIGGVGVVFLTR